MLGFRAKQSAREDGEKLVVAREQVRGQWAAIALARAEEMSASSTFPSARNVCGSITRTDLRA